MYTCMLVWRDRVLATDPVVMRSSPSARLMRYALLVNYPKHVESLSWLLTYLRNK